LSTAQKLQVESDELSQKTQKLVEETQKWFLGMNNV
jgi:hypothetical protein